jgi:uncharacterized Zn finger protein (UPF0148 family)
MAIEVVCASCGGMMLVEHPCGIIACPHCGEQLKSPDDESAESLSEESTSETPSDLEPDENLTLDSVDSSDPESIIETVSEPTERETGNSTWQDSVINHPGDSRTVSRLRYAMLAGYASAVTIAFVFYLWMTLGKSDSHQLESLPDVIPKERVTGEIERIVISENTPMLKGHSLRLGQSQRFGSLIVTPLEVTRGPLEFVHHADDFSQRKPATGPVLKLWLRFENVSEDQEFMPLGANLLFHRGATDRYPEKMRANNFVCRIDEKHEGGNHVLMYDHLIEDVWDLKGQNIERGLKPGEEFETYLPSREAGIDELTGQLIWRVHLRKGLNSKTGWGITTLIEAEFHSDAIEDETLDQEDR